VVLSKEDMERFPESNYGIQNRAYNTIEAACGALWVGYALLQEFEEKLTEVTPTQASLSSIK